MGIEKKSKRARSARCSYGRGLVAAPARRCVLAEHYASQGVKTCVVGLPKTIDGDLKNEHCEASFGFDTAAKLYAELVGNIMTDCTASRKYYHFIRLMGREASHLTLEVALLTQPNLAFIGEEVRAHVASCKRLLPARCRGELPP